MAHFAELDENNVVKRVIVVNNKELLDVHGVEQEVTGIKFCESLLGGRWVKTSYNKKIRKNYAGIGYRYDTELDAFIPPKNFPSWKLDKLTCQWVAPIPKPVGPIEYVWNESYGKWEEREYAESLNAIKIT